MLKDILKNKIYKSKNFYIVFGTILLLCPSISANASASLTISSSSIAADGRSLTINVGGIGTGPLLPASGATGFTVTDATTGVVQTVVGTTEGASTVTGTLAYQVNTSDNVLVGYTPGSLTDSAGTPNTMATISSATVTNNSTQTPANLAQIAAGNFASLPGLKAWYKADANVYKDAAKSTAATVDGDLVYTWANQVSGGIDAIQSTSGSRPTLKLTTNGIGGKPSLHFSGGQKLAVASLIDGTYNRAYTIFFVGVPKAASGTNAMFSVGTDSPIFHGFYPSSATTPSNTIINMEPGAGTGPYGNVSDLFRAFGMGADMGLTGDSITSALGIRYDGSQLAWSNNRLERVSAQTGAVATGDLVIGATAFYNLTGDISEIIVCNQALPTTVLKAVDDAEIAKYSIGLSRRVVWEGDSIVSQPSQAGGYAGLATANLPSLTYGLDVSSPGRPLADMLANISTRVLPLYTAGAPRNIIDLEGGCNDIFSGSVGNIPNTIAGGDTLYAQLVSYARIARANHFRVDVHTILPRDLQAIARREFNSQVRTNWQTFADGIVDDAADPIIGDNGLVDIANTNHNGKISISSPSTGQATATFSATLTAAPFAAGQQVQLLGGTSETMTVASCSTTSVTFTANIANTSHTSVQLAVGLAAYSTGQPTIAFTSTQPTAPYFTNQQVQFLGGTAEVLTVLSCSTTSVTFTSNIAQTGHTSMYQVDNYLGDAVHPTGAGALVMSGYSIATIKGTAYGFNPTQAGTDNGLFAGTLTAGTPTTNSVPLTWLTATGGTPSYTYQIQSAPNVVSSDGAANYDTPGTFVNNGASTSSLSGSATGLSSSAKVWLRVVVTDATAGTPIVNMTDPMLVQTASSVLSAGTASTGTITSSTVSVTATSSSGGFAPVTGQWYRSTTNGFTPGAGNIISGATALTFTDTSLTPATAYYYVYKYTDAGGTPQTALTPQILATTLAGPGQVTGLLSVNIGVPLSWGTVTGAVSYKVYRNGTVVLTPSTNNATDTVTAGTTNIYRISAVDSGNTEGAQSSPLTVGGGGSTTPAIVRR